MPKAFTRLTKVRFKHNKRVLEGVVSVNFISLHGTILHIVEWAGAVEGELYMSIKHYSELEEIIGTGQKDGEAIKS